MTDKKLAFVGAGSMAEAMISGLLQKKTLTEKQILVSNRSNHARLLMLKEQYGVQIYTSKKSLIEEADIIVLAMKPKDVATGLEEVKQYITGKHVIISVIAGISSDYILNELGKDIPIIRAMPNTSSTIGYSATTIAASKFALDGHLEIAESLFQSIGTVNIVEEDELHVSTGLAGSGPAYIYYIAEAMEKAATDLGLDIQISRHLIAQILIGAGQMLLNDDEDISTLRKNVTSPGGTTEAGINQLQNGNVQEAIQLCIKSAVERSKELSKVAGENLPKPVEALSRGM